MSYDPIKDVPEEQQSLLQKMVELKLVRRFGWNERTKVRVVVLTPKGKEFLGLVRKVSVSEPSRRVARLIALDSLADKEFVFGGYAND